MSKNKTVTLKFKRSFTTKADGIAAKHATFIPQSVLRQVHSPFQSEFSTQSDVVLPLAISRTTPFFEVIK